MTDNQQRKALLPCPMCGGEELPTDKKWNSRVLAHNLGCYFQLTHGNTRIMMGERYEESRYVTAWNTRTSSRPALSEKEMYEAAKKYVMIHPRDQASFKTLRQAVRGIQEAILAAQNNAKGEK